MSFASGTVISGKYKLRHKLGEGGMSAVYAATNLMTDAEVALKIMADHLRLRGEAASRFQEEARAAGKVRHPGVARVFDLGRDGARFWIAMELLQGETLADRLSRGPLSTPEIRDVFVQLLEILQCVHDAGIVHRDLKPQNVFLEREPAGRVRVRLLDFGIAKLSDSRLGAYATPFGFALGTLGYMAPEQTQATSVDARADIYAVGVMLYECVVGSLPFHCETLSQLIDVQLVGSAPPLSIASGAQAYARVALTCLRLERRHRPGSCDNVLEALSRLHSVDDREATLTFGTATAARRSRAGAIARALTAVAVLVGVSVHLTSRGRAVHTGPLGVAASGPHHRVLDVDAALRSPRRAPPEHLESTVARSPTVPVVSPLLPRDPQTSAAHDGTKTGRMTSGTKSELRSDGPSSGGRHVRREPLSHGQIERSQSAQVPSGVSSSRSSPLYR